MQASQACYDFVKKCEGFYAHAYDDGGGVQTIGWGTIKWDMSTPVKKGETITVEQAQRQLEIEVHRVEDAINTSVKVPLTQAEFDALVSLFYNIGTGWCTGYKHKQSNLIKLLNQGKYNAVPAQFLLFERDIHGKYVEGLAKRRKWEAQMWLSDGDHSHIAAAVPENDPASTPMPQAVTPSKAEPTVKTVVASPSARWSLAGIAAGAGTWLDSVFGWSTKTAQQVVDVNGDTNGIQTIIGTLTHNAGQIAVGFMVLALVMVLGRKLAAAAAGRSF